MHVHHGEGASFEVRQIEKKLSQATRAWTDELHESLLTHFGEAHGQSLMHQYGSAFRADDRENYPAVVAALDAERMEGLREGCEHLALHLYRPLEATNGVLRLGIDRINAVFRNAIKYRQVIKPSSIGASTRCGSKSRPGAGRNSALQQDFFDGFHAQDDSEPAGASVWQPLVLLVWLRVYQANKLAWGGAFSHEKCVVMLQGEARDGGKRPAAWEASLRSRCVRIFSITIESSTQAIILMWPPQLLQISMSMSILKTRFKRCPQVMAARRSAGVVSSGASAVTGLAVLAAFSRRNLCTMRAVRREHTMEAS
ncbi:MAG: hypothetical protein ACI9DC_005729 [Gammaproteobacteria bacterium]|jgi:hypothetical protein